MLVFRQAREGVLKKTKGKYPAPLAALDAVQRGYSDGYRSGTARGGAPLRRTHRVPRVQAAGVPVLRHHRAEEGQRAARRRHRRAARRSGSWAFSVPGSWGRASRRWPSRPGRWCASRMRRSSAWRAGWRAVRDVVRERSEAAPDHARCRWTTCLPQVGGTTDYSGFASARAGDRGGVRGSRREAAGAARSGSGRPAAPSSRRTRARFPSPTSPPRRAHPERVVGMHFFSPVHKMPLLEVIVTPQTGADTIATVVQYGTQLGKTVIVVRDGPGFYVNRILVAVPQRGRDAARRGRGHRRHRRRIDGLRVSRGADHAARRGRTRHRRQVGAHHGGGVRRAHATVGRAAAGSSRAVAWAARRGADSTVTTSRASGLVSTTRCMR